MRRSGAAAVLTVLACLLPSCAGTTETGESPAGGNGKAPVNVTQRPAKVKEQPTVERQPSAPEPTKAAPHRQPSAPQPANIVPTEPALWPVVRVVDGDSVEGAYHGRSESVRLIGIDTPETVQPTEPVACWGPRASAAAQRLLGGQRVEVRFDPTQGRRDVYDRLLAYLIIPGRGDFGALMVRRGDAAEYTYDSAYARQALYRAAEAQARAENRGLWGQCGGVHVPLHTRQPKPPPGAKPAPQGGGGAGCEPGYSPCVPPYPPDLDCADVGGPIAVTGSDPHGLDADGDGVARES